LASTAYIEADGALQAARKDAREFLAAKPDPSTWSAEDKATSKSHEAKMADLHDKVADLQQAEKLAADAAEPARKSAGRVVDESDGEIKSGGTKVFDLGEALAESNGMKLLLEKGNGFRGTAEIVTIPSMKTLLTLADMTPQSDRRPLVPSVQDETTVADLMLSGSTSSNVISYYEETTFTNAAAAVTEGDAKQESALDFTERTDTVRKIATWIPATSEFLEDNDGLRSYIEQRLVFMLKQEEEDQLLNGNGTPPNISGVLDRSGVQSIGSTNDLDAIYQAMTEVRVDGGAEPTAVVIHPLSWQNLRLAKTATDENYFGPGPFAPDNVERIWGLPVRITPKIAEGTALVGAFRPHAQVFRKGGISVLASTEHASYFIENKVAILVEERLALAVYRPTAFCSVTGLASS
jgi:HK97 family phage major capsid protein